MSYASEIGGQHGAINPITPSGEKPAIQVNVADGVANEGAGSASQVEHADLTSLSSAGGLVAQALESSDTRSMKVASLQQAIATGSYSVPSSDVAEKIMQSLFDKA